MIDTIASKVLVVKPTISMVGKSVTDETLTNEVQSEHSIGRDGGAWVKKLYPSHNGKPSALAAIQSIVSQARKFHGLQTLRSSFGDLLPSVAYSDYTARMEEYRAKYDDEADYFSLKFPEILANCREVLNGSFDRNNYPSEHNVRSRFTFTLATAPLPRSSDMLVKYLGEAQTATVQANLARQVEIAAQNGVKQAMERVLQQVAHITDVLTRPSTKIYDSLIENLQDLLKLVPAFNLTNDPTLSSLVHRCQADLLVAPDVLRESAVNRVIVAGKAKIIADTYGALGNRKLAA
jgi:hypothetical protein